MRAAAATLAVVIVAVVASGCAPSIQDSPPIVSAMLSSAGPATAEAPAGAARSAVPEPTLSIPAGSATPLASIHRGPVQARIEAVRESDGKQLAVGVDAPEAVAADPLITVNCGSGAPDGDFSVVVQDLTIESGIATATVGVPRPVTDPGSYDGVVTFLDVNGDAYRGAGMVEVLDGLESGRFDVSDPATGDRLTGSWSCKAL
ncbi:hypothetical protein RN607_08050 [Demequina capsici]|uniref:Uncharacterized protein n=1 Tax=Demequina capsici TaxID=3075620 RepID=A0AA96F536_9MICO|nr:MULTISPECIES: hypothetical protein [unclassified Demequina]WNM23273.1 hypothetical protein RN606_07815 [Demequina sp. OYTSA14]WNM26151.1 hypothetical protein RN607_08050 [Demequina sp. PMTSA13]